MFLRARSSRKRASATYRARAARTGAWGLLAHEAGFVQARARRAAITSMRARSVEIDSGEILVTRSRTRYASFSATERATGVHGSTSRAAADWPGAACVDCGTPAVARATRRARSERRAFCESACRAPVTRVALQAERRRGDHVDYEALAPLRRTHAARSKRAARRARSRNRGSFQRIADAIAPLSLPAIERTRGQNPRGPSRSSSALARGPHCRHTRSSRSDAHAARRSSGGPPRVSPT